MVIVDEALSQRFWPGADPIGRRMYFPQRPEDVANPGPDAIWLQVVGVVSAVKLKGLVEGGEQARVGAYYLPFAQNPSGNVGFAIRMRDDAERSGVTTAVPSVDTQIRPSLDT